MARDLSYAILMSARAPAPVVVVRGTGSIGLRHLRVFRDLLGCRVLAAPLRPERGEVVARDGYTPVASLTDAAAHGATLAVIATDTVRHLVDATEALLAGMHVLVEKPLGVDARGVKALENQATVARRSVHVACNLRFNAGLARFRARLGEVKAIHAVRIECQSYLPAWRPHDDYRRGYSARADEGGVLRDLIHEIDYAIWLYGAPREVFCRMANTGQLGIEAEESADLLWTAPAGPVVSIRLDYLTRTARRRMIAFGEAGEIEWDAIRDRIDVRTAGGEASGESAGQTRDAMMQAQAEEFLLAASGGDAPRLATLEEGAVAVAVCDAARRSAGSGKTEPVEDWATA